MQAAQRVAIVTDSTSYLPADLAATLGVRVVPLQIELAGRVGREGIDISPAAVTQVLRDRGTVSTSRPPPAEFVESYRQALADGASAVVSVHLSAQLSG